MGLKLRQPAKFPRLFKVAPLGSSSRWQPPGMASPCLSKTSGTVGHRHAQPLLILLLQARGGGGWLTRVGPQLHSCKKLFMWRGGRGTVGQSLCSGLRRMRKGQGEWPGGSKRNRRKDAQMMARASWLAMWLTPSPRIIGHRKAGRAGTLGPGVRKCQELPVYYQAQAMAHGAGCPEEPRLSSLHTLIMTE